MLFRKFVVTYPCGKDSYRKAKDRYFAGSRVRFYFPVIGTDTDYSFYLDGVRLNALYGRRCGYVIKFRMPEHDAVFTHTATSSMMR